MRACVAQQEPQFPDEGHHAVPEVQSPSATVRHTQEPHTLTPVVNKDKWDYQLRMHG